VTGTWINALAILLGTSIAIVSKKDLSQIAQQRIKIVLAVFAMYVGISLLWESMHGGVIQHLKQMLLLFTALVVGNMAGRLLGIQKKLNRLVMFAKDQFDKPSKSQGFKLTSALYCLTPFAAIGACMEGLTGDYRTLLLKAVMDGMAAHSFYRLFGGSVVLSAIPLLAFQGNLTLIVHWMKSQILIPDMVDGMMGIAGLLVFTSIVLITNTAKPRLADYLPSLIVIAPLAYWFW